jgi:hypothetical protein
MLTLSPVSASVGIPGLFTVLYATNQSVARLMYEGRRWRISTQGFLVGLLNMSFIPASTPFVVGMATIVNTLIVDLVFNSIHGSFKRKNRLSWWVILSLVYYYLTHSLWIVLFSSLFFYPFELVLLNWYIPLILVFLPIMIVQAIIGGFFGYHIYRRVKKIYS